VKNLYVDIHVLQDVPPANLNRDDTGSPKSARYGGVDRLRVSSQAWKRATRLDFSRHMGEDELGVRTRRVHETLVKSLMSAGIPEDGAKPVASELLKQINITPGKKSEETAYLLFFSRSQFRVLAEAVRERAALLENPAALAQEIDVPAVLGRGHSLDVALFGRMVADLPALNVDAAVQVSHALATHAAPTQFDYFTAVDDAQENSETGAGMIGTVEYNAATLYRFATVNVRALVENMSDRCAAVRGCGQFIRSFVTSMPSGKQNTFAAHTRPGLVLVAVRSDQPVNFISAFEKPVRAGDTGYLRASVKELAAFATDEGARWGDRPLHLAASYAANLADEAAPLGPSITFDELVDGVRSAVDDALNDD